MLNCPGIAENPEGIGGPRSIQFFGVGFQDSHKYIEELGPGMGEPRRMVAVVIDEPERRSLLKRLIARFPEDLGNPAVRPFVLAPSEELLASSEELFGSPEKVFVRSEGLSASHSPSFGSQSLPVARSEGDGGPREVSFARHSLSFGPSEALFARHSPEGTSFEERGTSSEGVF